jgi:hypothetical protein
MQFKPEPLSHKGTSEDAARTVVRVYFPAMSAASLIASSIKPSKANTMAGIVVFSSVSEALRAGFQIYDRTSSGYLVRTRTARGWALALVHVVSPDR